MTNQAPRYLVEYTIVVDYPERRDASFRPVPAGTRCPQAARFVTRKGALAFVAEIVTGQHDFSSEMVSTVRCTMSIHARVFGVKSWRTVVPRTDRGRP